MTVRLIEVMKKATARMAVLRVSTLEVPRLEKSAPALQQHRDDERDGNQEMNDQQHFSHASGNPRPLRGERFSADGPPLQPSGISLDYADEIGGFEARAADQGAVDIVAVEQFRGIVGLDRPAIQYGHPPALFFPSDFNEIAA